MPGMASYMGIELTLVVGICRGTLLLLKYQEIFLGDVIISDSIIEYDFSRQYPSGFQWKTGIKDILGRPSLEIQVLLNSLWVSNILFKASYLHKYYNYTSPAGCSCLGKISEANPTSIYIRLVASTNIVIKSGQASVVKAFLEYWIPTNHKDVSRNYYLMIPFEEIQKIEDLISALDGLKKLAITGLDREPKCSIFWILCTSHEIGIKDVELVEIGGPTAPLLKVLLNILSIPNDNHIIRILLDISLARYISLLSKYKESIIELFIEEFEDNRYYIEIQNPDILESILLLITSIKKKVEVLGVLKVYSFVTMGYLPYILYLVDSTERYTEVETLACSPEHPDTLTSGKYEEVEAMHQQVLQGYEKVLGPEHPYTLTMSASLVLFLHSRVLQGYEKVLGPEHPYTLTSVSNLASVLADQGKYEEVLGPEHPDTLTSISNLASETSHKL
ncbi:hypothetical protein BDW71DRAFT_201637 [Aspergillus fruticulosus]